MRRMTFEDIARMANVSKATVSRVVNRSDGVGEETRRKVEETIAQLDYDPAFWAKGSSGCGTRNIGLVMPQGKGAFFSELVAKIVEFAGEKGYCVLLCSAGSERCAQGECIRKLLARHVEGLILSPFDGEHPEEYRQPKKYRVPTVLLERAPAWPDYDAGVFMDKEYAAFCATDLLIKNGHARVAFVQGRRAGHESESVEGYKNALLTHHLPSESGLVLEKEDSVDGGRQAVDDLLKDKVSFSALVMENEHMASGAIRELARHGRKVPQDVEVIAFGNRELGQLIDPGLSTIEFSAAEVARYAVDTLCMLMEGVDPPVRTIRLDARIDLRGSTRQQT